MKINILLAFALLSFVSVGFAASGFSEDANIVLLMASERRNAESYLHPKPSSSVFVTTYVANDSVFQLMKLDGGGRAVMYVLRLSKKYTELIYRVNIIYFEVSGGEWLIDDKPPAEAPLGGLATREFYSKVIVKMNSGKWSKVGSWADLTALSDELSTHTSDE